MRYALSGASRASSRQRESPTASKRSAAAFGRATFASPTWERWQCRERLTERAWLPRAITPRRGGACSASGPHHQWQRWPALQCKVHCPAQRPCRGQIAVLDGVFTSVFTLAVPLHQRARYRWMLFARQQHSTTHRNSITNSVLLPENHTRYMVVGDTSRQVGKLQRIIGDVLQSHSIGLTIYQFQICILDLCSTFLNGFSAAS